MENKREPLRIAEKGGTITIGQPVVTAITQYAAARTLGAARTASAGGRETSKSSPPKGRFEQIKKIRVEIGADESRHSIDAIEISIVLHEGQPIPTVAAALQRSVKETVENMTGFSVSRVDLEIRDIIASKKRAGKGGGKPQTETRKESRRKTH